ncbi:MAG TPA: CocE/NonD family hydrolase C-terminal non-catalytic domain-containing protein, partial [Salinisphaeraceae bacterium]|nr:CocE/NonD family hydrolase C-terminal non-catalytic domain-containing protein [Salinisphaeraceae bacterium]
EPGKRYRVRLQLNDIAQHFPAGHRIRLALSSSYWPLVWPSPEPVTLTVYPQDSTLILPLRPPRSEDADLPALPQPTASMPASSTEIEPAVNESRIIHDLASQRFTVDSVGSDGVYRLEATNTTLEKRGHERYTAVANDPCSCAGETHWTLGFKRGDWDVATHTRTRMTVDKDNFHIHATLEALESGAPVYEDEWHITIPRDQV